MTIVPIPAPPAPRPFPRGAPGACASLWLAVLLLAGCGGGLPVRTNYDPAGSRVAENYRTWSWLADPGTRPPVDSALAATIRFQVEAALAGRNYTRSDSAPDFLVGFHVIDAEPALVPEINMYYGYTWGRWFPGGGAVFQGGYRAELPAGALIVDVADGAARELIWRGVAALDLHRSGPAGAQGRRRMGEAIRQMFQRFPDR